jgi:hypothetical protein
VKGDVQFSLSDHKGGQRCVLSVEKSVSELAILDQKGHKRLSILDDEKATSLRVFGTKQKESATLRVEPTGSRLKFFDQDGKELKLLP